MSALLHLLSAGDALPSALDVDVAALGVPEPPPVAAPGEQRLSSFDVADEDAEARARTRRRVTTAVVAALGLVVAAAGSVAFGL